MYNMIMSYIVLKYDRSNISNDVVCNKVYLLLFGNILVNQPHKILPHGMVSHRIFGRKIKNFGNAINNVRYQIFV